MDVKFVTVRKSNLNAVPVVDGQVIAVEDANGFYYDQNSQRYPVSRVRVLPKLEGVGRYEEICVVTSGDAPGLYVWDDTSKSYWLIANKDTDLYIRFVKSANLEKVYVTGTNGEDDSWESYWNENVHMDLKNGTITAVEFKGKASDSYKADNATHSQSSDEAEHAKVSDKIGTQTVGDPFTAVYVLNGVPTACSHSVKKDVSCAHCCRHRAVPKRKRGVVGRSYTRHGGVHKRVGGQKWPGSQAGRRKVQQLPKG